MRKFIIYIVNIYYYKFINEKYSYHSFKSINSKY